MHAPSNRDSILLLSDMEKHIINYAVISTLVQSWVYRREDLYVETPDPEKNNKRNETMT